MPRARMKKEERKVRSISEDASYCFNGCMALLRGGQARPISSSAAIPPGASTPALEGQGLELLREQVQGLVSAEMKALEESLTGELRSILGRLLKAEGQSPNASNVTVDDTAALPLHNRPESRRRWTCAADGADSLATILRRATAGDDLEDAPPDYEVTAESSMVHTPVSDRTASSSVRKSISFNREVDEESGSEEDEVAEEERSPACDGENSIKSGSSVVWRIDALDCGDRLAASAAATKGRASVDAIVELVEAERQSWAEEKAALEARLEELKDQRQARRRGGPDAEKAELRRQVQELRETMKQRSRFGAWVCERHMQESDEEESPTGLEKEELRETLAALEAELRKVREEAAATAQGPGSSGGG
mmetsp:Transcript_103317/g.333268  ORF Transcript_103317/g.333268 Transcript_103317/m.333268 type:complete len:367 (-) Transcript_103317:254-1354(-)